MQSHQGSWALKSDNVNNWAYWNNAFSPEECKKIIEIGESKIVQKASIENNILNESIRNSDISWLYPTDIDWVYQRLTDIIHSLNNQFFNFQLFGMIEGMQFTKYVAPSGFYGLHMDKTFNGATRKLSIIIQLTDPSEYEGGELIIKTSNDDEVMIKQQGVLFSFPSYILHEVKPVTKGTRYSLVIWVSGEPFK